jgi:peptidoglycan/LPS O-acetylase OafA/YrhL
MFGAFRLALALMVVWYHLIDREFSGRIAVFGFFCLSGYLMTRVVNETYGDGAAGFLRYLANRGLRIYPPYLVVIGLTAAIVALWPAAEANFRPGTFLAENSLRNIAIFGLWPYVPAIVSPAWSLNNELLYYIAIGALLGRSRLACFLWFIAAIEIPLGAAVRYDIDPDAFYFSLMGSSAAFASGSMIWHFDRHLPRSERVPAALAAALLVVMGLCMSREIGDAGGLYAGLAVAATAIVFLRNLAAPGWDRWLGAFAYPVFLVHMPAHKIIAAALMDDGPLVKVCAVLATALLSWLLILMVDRPIERLRGVLRKPARRPAASEPAAP